MVLLTMTCPFIPNNISAQEVSAEDSTQNIKKPEIRYFEVVKLEKCRLFFPDNFDPDKEYPLVIGLHGTGGSSKYFSGLWSVLKKHNVIYAVPESPYNYPDRFGKPSDRYTWGIVSDKHDLWERADPPITEYISGIARSLKTEYKITNTIILGFSQGAGFAYATGIRYNKDIDGLICFGGRIPSVENYPWFLSEGELQNNNNIKVYIAHGMNDMAISSYEGRKSYRKLKKLGYNTHFRLFEGEHELPDEILDEAIEWMLKN
jgi:predicted esterase